MFGRVHRDNGTDIIETIAGPTDGSTDIVHHDDNCDYQLATAQDAQFGAGYLGITCCCPILYNPSSGNMTVKCVTGTATNVNVNNNSNDITAQPVLVQGLDEDGILDNSVEKSVMTYNPNCYVCNDEETGEPICKPVTYIPTLCADEILGIDPDIDVEETDANVCLPLVLKDTRCEKTTLATDTCPNITYNPATNVLHVPQVNCTTYSNYVTAIIGGNDPGVRNSTVCVSRDETTITASKGNDYCATLRVRHTTQPECMNGITLSAGRNFSGNQWSNYGSFYLGTDVAQFCTDKVCSFPTCVHVVPSPYTNDPLNITVGNANGTNLTINGLPYTECTNTHEIRLTGVDTVDGKVYRLECLRYCNADQTLYGNFGITNMHAGDSCCFSCICVECNKVSAYTYSEPNEFNCCCSGIVLDNSNICFYELENCDECGATLCYGHRGSICITSWTHGNNDYNYAATYGTQCIYLEDTSDWSGGSSLINADGGIRLVGCWESKNGNGRDDWMSISKNSCVYLYGFYDNNTHVVKNSIRFNADQRGCTAREAAVYIDTCQDSQCATYRFGCDGTVCMTTDGGTTWNPLALRCDIIRDVSVNSLAELKALPYGYDYDIYFTTAFNVDNGCPIEQYSGARWYRSMRTNYLLTCSHNGSSMCIFKACNDGNFYFEQKFPYPGTMYGTASSNVINVCGTL